MRSYKLIPVLFLLGILTSQAQKKDTLLFVNDSLTIALPDVFVNAERPLVKVTDQALQYDIPALIKAKPVNTAYEVLADLPGLMLTGDQISIIGAPSTTLILNGRKSSMTAGQLIQFLQSTSAGKIRNIEVMYSTPPRYGVKGASININTEKNPETAPSIQTDVSLTGRQAHYFSPSAIFNFTYSAHKRIFDFSYAIDSKKTWSKEEMDAYPILHTKEYQIEQLNKATGKPLTHQIKAGFSQEFKNKSLLAFTYRGNVAKKKTHRFSNTDFVGIEQTYTYNELNAPSGMHNLRLDYRASAYWNAGTDYTFYKVKNEQTLRNDYTESAAEKIQALSRQKVNRGNLYLSYTRPLARQFTFNAGADVSLSGTSNSSYTRLNEKENPEATFKQQEKEYEIGGYIGLTKKFGPRLSLDLSLNVEYNRADVDSAGKKEVLWKDVNFFPQLTLTWQLPKSQILQLNFSSNKKYPAYWQLSPSLSYLNTYSVVAGNPLLKPEKIYSARLNYIIKRKYILGLFANHQADYIRQTYYQSQTELRATYQTINFDAHNLYGLMGVLPVRYGEFANSRLTVTGFLIHDKGRLHELLFDRKKLYGRFMLTHTFFLSRQKNLSLEVSGYYGTRSIQGFYDVGEMYDLSAGLIWRIAKRKCSFTLRGEDLLNGRQATTIIHEKGQQSRMKLFTDTRMVSLTVRYSFGQVKKKTTDKPVDTSRFGGI